MSRVRDTGRWTKMEKQVTAGDMLAETARQILQGILRERWRQE